LCPNITVHTPKFIVFIVEISFIYTINGLGAIGSKGEQRIPSNYKSKTSYNYRQE